MTALTLDIATLDKNLLRQVNIIDHIDRDRKLALSFSAINLFFKSVDQLYVHQKSSYEELLKTSDSIGYLTTVSVDALVYRFDTDKYKALYQYKDHLLNRLKLCKMIDDQYSKIGQLLSKHNKAMPYLHFLATWKVRSINSKIRKEAIQRLKQVELVLGKVDALSESSDSKDSFTSISQDQLWSDRCKAYDYLV